MSQTWHLWALVCSWTFALLFKSVGKETVCCLYGQVCGVCLGRLVWYDTSNFLQYLVDYSNLYFAWWITLVVIPPGSDLVDFITDPVLDVFVTFVDLTFAPTFLHLRDSCHQYFLARRLTDITDPMRDLHVPLPRPKGWFLNTVLSRSSLSFFAQL